MMYSNLSPAGSAPRYHNQHRRSCTLSSLPQQGSAANSLRSTQISLRSGNNSSLLRNSMANDSIPIDPMVSNEEEKSEVAANKTAETKVSSNILPIFILESLSLICLASLAYFLRLTDSFGVLVRGFFCDDKTISYPYNPTFGKNATPVMTGFSHQVFYCTTVGIPILLIIICEIIRMVFQETDKKKVIAAQSGCITCRIHMILRRIFRFIGGFFYGLLITSIITDTLKLVTGRMRPYFLNVCQSITEICKSSLNNSIGGDFDNQSHTYFPHKWIDPNQFTDEVLCQNKTDLLRQARMSFPSSTASITSFSVFFIILYVSFVIKFRSGQIIRLWLNSCALISLLIVVTGKVTRHENHVEDVIVSLFIGVMFAFYICYTQLNLFEDKNQDKNQELSQPETNITLSEEEENAWFWKYFHIPRVNLLRRSARYFRKTHSPAANGSAFLNPAFQHKEFDREFDSKQTDSNATTSTFHHNYRQ